MFDPLLEVSHRDNLNKGSSIGIGEEITQVEPIEVHLRTLSGALSKYMYLVVKWLWVSSSTLNAFDWTVRGQVIRPYS